MIVSSGGEDKAGATPAGETPAGETPAGETPAGETPAGETPAGETPAGETPAGETPAGETPAGETPAGETPAGETPAGETPAGETPAGETPVDADSDRFSPPEDCDDDDPNVNPDADEVCDGVDNDCDNSIDEGVLNACGQCGPLPPEVCDGSDNDCDGSVDEGTLNSCGECGDVPLEVCDERDNDCDGQADEGVTNACGQCGDVPNEVCDGRDNDCDGTVDERTLNACGQCGQVPSEVCDGQDNDCDGSIDEGLPLNFCGSCGTLPIEICDGVDNDCDDQVDEDLSSPCFTLKHTIEANEDVVEMGSLIKIVGDLNGDGINDALIRSERFGRVRVLAYSGDGSRLWSIQGDGEFATDIAGGRFFGGDDIYIAINDPDNSRVIIYNDQGDPYVTHNVAEGEPTSLEALRGNNRDTLVYSVPFTDRGGLIRRLRFRNDSPSNPNIVYSTFGNPNETTAERIFNVGNLIGNGAEDLLFTNSFFRSTGVEDIGTVLMDGSTGRPLSGSIFTPFQNSYFSFAYDVTIGSFDPQSNRSFAYGAPLISDPEDQGAVYFLHESGSEYTIGAPLFGGVESSGIGLQLETLTRLNAIADTLVIGGFGELTYRDFSENGQRVPVPLPNHNLYLGLGLAIDDTPAEDGTYPMWVSGLSEVGGESRVWILRAR